MMSGNALQTDRCGVEVWLGGLGGTYRVPALSFAGASLEHTKRFVPNARRERGAFFNPVGHLVLPTSVRTLYLSPVVSEWLLPLEFRLL